MPNYAKMKREDRKIDRVYWTCRRINRLFNESNNRHRQLVNATRLWNLIDHWMRPNGIEVACWGLMQRYLSDCFFDPSDANSMQFTYNEEN